MIFMSRFANLPKVKATQVTVVTAGVPVQGTDVLVPAGTDVVILAHPSNTGTISVAESSTNALNTGTTSMLLEAGQSLAVQVRNFSALWFDSTVSSDKVRLFTEKE